LGILSCGR